MGSHNASLSGRFVSWCTGAVFNSIARKILQKGLKSILFPEIPEMEDSKPGEEASNIIKKSKTWVS